MIVLALTACSWLTPPDSQTVSGPFYSLDLPGSWEVQPTKNVAQEQATAGAWRAPVPEPDLRVVITRPVPFEGTPQAFADTQIPSFEMVGIGVGERSDGKAGKLPAHIVSASAPDALFRYWFFVQNGFASAIQCGGRGAKTSEDLAVCDSLAASLQITGPFADAAVKAEPEGSKTLTVHGWSMTVPTSWMEFDRNAIPGAVWVVRSDKMLGRGFPNANLVVNPWMQDLKAFSDAGDADYRAMGVKLLEKKKATFLGAPGNRLISEWPLKMGGHRAVEYETVIGGESIVLACTGDPNFFAQTEADCDVLAASLTRL